MCTYVRLDPWVAAAVSHLPVGVFTSRHHDGRNHFSWVASRTVQPLSAVSGSIIAEMLQPYTDVVDDIVTTHLGIEKVTVASQFGTYRTSAPPSVCSPPMLWPPLHRSPKQGRSVTWPPCPNSSSTRSARQFDPFSWAVRPVQLGSSTHPAKAPWGPPDRAGSQAPES